ncbi:MAG: hypothetical protein WC223_05105 [Bacteroidales bacterium]|jgi:hypothetical protein
MAKKRNSYEKEAMKKGLLGSITQDLDTKGDLKNTAIETVKDLAVGVIGGGIVGAAIGRISLAIGALVTGIGHYTKSRLASVFGIGMMASNGFQTKSSSVSGTEENQETGVIEGVKERVMNFKDSFSQKLYLDKLPIGKKTDEEKKDGSTKGVGEVKYLVYPANKEEASAMNDLENIEKRIAASAAEFAQKHEVSGTDDKPDSELGNESDNELGSETDNELGNEPDNELGDEPDFQNKNY